MTISVVIPVHDDAEHLAVCLGSIFAKASTPTDEPLQVVVVDDGSGDRPEEVAERYPVELVRLNRCRGAAHARNVGVRHARGEVVLFTDADCEVMADWAPRFSDALRRAHAENPAVVALSGKVDSAAGWVEKGHAYAGYAYVQGGAERPTECFNTACAAIFRPTFERLEGFTEELKAHEDHDFGLRLKAGGHRTRFVPEIEVFHRHGIHSWRQMLSKHYRWGLAAGLKIERWHPQRLGRFLALLRNPLSHFLLIVPLALLTTGKIVRHLLPIDRRVLLYSPTILLSKLAFRWGCFRERNA